MTPQAVAARKGARKRAKRRAGFLAAFFLLVVVVLSIALASGDNSSSSTSAGAATAGGSKAVTRAQLGTGWTLRANRAVVGCTLAYPPSRSIVELTLAVDGKLYALNGTATDDPSGTLGRLRFPPDRLFEHGVGDVSGYMDAARKLC